MLSEKTTQNLALCNVVDVFGQNAKDLPDFLGRYLDLKNALVKDDYTHARKAASGMKKALENSNNLDEKQQAHLKATVEKLIDAGHIDGQRVAFAVLSEQLHQILPGIDFGDKVLFWQNCPMALGGRGGNWISLEEQVQNPFMGQRILNCGTTLEKLKR